jgi:class 3 adenylate cyclase
LNIGIFPFNGLFMDPFSINPETLSLTEIIRLQNQLSTILSQRFERQMALVFSDIVGSTSYFSRFGDEAGHRLQQHHIDFLSEVIKGNEGQILHTAGDGALLAFSSTGKAVEALLCFKKHLGVHNCRLTSEQQWTTRVGIHWGSTLIDGSVIAGDSVNVCAKMASMAQPGQICLTKFAFDQLQTAFRAACQAIGSVTIPGSDHSWDIMELLWRDFFNIPSAIRIVETEEEFSLPEQPVVTIGRLAEAKGTRVNDIVLKLPDPQLTQQISRWHIEIRRGAEGLVLQVISDKLTEVDGQRIPQHHSVPITIGSKVRLSGVITLIFLPQRVAQGGIDETLIHPLHSNDS